MENLSDPELSDSDIDDKNCFSDIEEDINDDIFNIDINYYYDDYYINKYNDHDMYEDIKENMNLCIEYNCFNFKKAGDEYCLQCCYEQDTVNEYETFDEFIETVLNGYIHEDIIYDIINKNNEKVLNDNIFNNTKRYICKLDNVKVLTLDEIHNRLLCYHPVKNKIKNTPEQNKRKKELQKFNNKYNQLLKLNEKTLKWCDNNNIGFYKRKIECIFIKNMSFLDEYVVKYGKRMEDLRRIYNWIYNDLINSWEMEEPDEEEDIRDLDLILKQEWKEYAIYEDEDYKRMLKI